MFTSSLNGRVKAIERRGNAARIASEPTQEDRDKAEGKAWGAILTAMTNEELDDFETYYNLIEERDALTLSALTLSAGRYQAPEGSCGDARLDALVARFVAQAQTDIERILKGEG